jgi:8-oxo-dGTP pyrophosphatase MutT (NUDIX family)
MKYEKSCGAVVFTRINGQVKFALVQQLHGFYSFPKGHVEKGETEQETALREIYEEIHITPTLIDGFRMVDEHPVPNKPGVIKQVVYFLGEYTDQEIVFQREELLSAPLVSYEEAMDLFEYESSKRILNEAYRFISEL